MHTIVQSWKGLLATVGFAVLPIFYAVIWGIGAWDELQDPLARIPKLGAHSLPLSTEIFDRRGEKIGEFSDERRYFVSLSSLPKHVIHAFLSAEDKHFYDHRGVSLSSILRAAVANLKGGGYRQGASTITQQLARMHFLSQEKSLTRKFKEVILALAIEKKFSKAQILELYLNTIYLGSRSHGIEAAARNFFRKGADKLSVVEAATIAALPKSPAYYSPQRHPKRALQRRAWVLSRMAEDGFISPGMARKLGKTPLSTAKGPEDHWAKAPYFVAAVLRDLYRKFELNGLPRNGLRVYTTLDSRLQKVAEQNLRKQLSQIEKRMPAEASDIDRLEGALVIIEPDTGGVLAMQGGRRFAESQFNRSADTVRPIGTLLYPFLLALALERGLSPLSPISAESMGRPSSFAPKASMSPTLADLLFDSDLKDWNALAPLVGYGSVLDVLKRVRLIDDNVKAFDPSRDVQSSPIHVGLSYASLVNGGYTVSSHIVQRVEDRDGHVLFDFTNSKVRDKQVFDQKIAFITRELMAVSPYSQLPPDLDNDLPQTTSTFGRSLDGRDVWFVGLVPSAVSVLWIGSEHGRISLDLNTESAKYVAHSFWRQASPILKGPESISDFHFVPPTGIAYMRIPDAKGQGVNIPIVAGTEASIGETRL
jgi:membrane carboxypeptidase/penicillin-binding protein